MLSEDVVSILGQLIKRQNYMSKKGKFPFFASEVCYDLVPIHSNSLADDVSEPSDSACCQLKPLPKLGPAADDFDSWALTAGILLSKVLFSSNKRTRL